MRCRACGIDFPLSELRNHGGRGEDAEVFCVPCINKGLHEVDWSEVEEISTTDRNWFPSAEEAQR